MLIMRVDDRLIHGQVIAGWVRPLGIDRLILSSNSIANDQWMRKAYTLAVPGDVELSILSLDDTVEALRNSDQKEEKSMVIVESLVEAKNLIDHGLTIKKLNLGCIGYSEGKVEITPYIYLTRKEICLIKSIYNNGIVVEAQALPNSPAVDLLNVINHFDTKCT